MSPSSSPTTQSELTTQFSATIARRTIAPDSTRVFGMMTLSSMIALDAMLTPANSTLPRTVPCTSQPSAMSDCSTMALPPMKCGGMIGLRA